MIKFASGLLAAIAVATLPATAFANTASQPGNCAVYAEMLSDTVQADPRVTGAAESEAVETLDKFAAHLSGIVENGMADTYKQAAAFGMDKASVDQQMKAGEDAIRAGFTGPTMEPGRVYTDHLLVMNDCGKFSAQRGEIGAADAEKLGQRMNAVYMAIR